MGVVTITTSIIIVSTWLKVAWRVIHLYIVEQHIKKKLFQKLSSGPFSLNPRVRHDVHQCHVYLHGTTPTKLQKKGS